MTSADLPKLASVPRGYRHLVESGKLFENRICGDVNFMAADRIVDCQGDFEALKDFPHLQPFAKTACGHLWCWNTNGGSGEPQIWHVEYWGVAKVYAPNFEAFLFRGYLEDASSITLRYEDDARLEFQTVATLLHELGRKDMAADVDLVSRLEVVDFTSDKDRSLRITRHGVLTVAACRERVSRFLGPEYLDEHECNV